jgi:hypothetical protein
VVVNPQVRKSQREYDELKGISGEKSGMFCTFQVPE